MPYRLYNYIHTGRYRFSYAAIKIESNMTDYRIYKFKLHILFFNSRHLVKTITACIYILKMYIFKGHN